MYITGTYRIVSYECCRKGKMKLKLKTLKFGEITFYIDKEDLDLLDNHKIYACKPNKKKIYLIRDDKKWLHKLIMPNCPKNYVIDHINRNTLDNRKCNLRYATKSLNKENTNTLKLKEKDISDILTSNLKQNDLAEKYKVSQVLISHIKTGKLYKSYCPEIIR